LSAKKKTVDSYQRTLCCIFRSRSWSVLKCI
jgi:hypothetical protein